MVGTLVTGLVDYFIFIILYPFSRSTVVANNHIN